MRIWDRVTGQRTVCTRALPRGTTVSIASPRAFGTVCTRWCLTPPFRIRSSLNTAQTSHLPRRLPSLLFFPAAPEITVRPKCLRRVRAGRRGRTTHAYPLLQLPGQGRRARNGGERAHRRAHQYRRGRRNRGTQPGGCCFSQHVSSLCPTSGRYNTTTVSYLPKKIVVCEGNTPERMRGCPSRSPRPGSFRAGRGLQ